MERIVELNRGPFVAAPPEPAELAAPPEGAQILDARPVEAFAAGHLPGALNVPVSGTRFATKAAFVLDDVPSRRGGDGRGRGGGRDPRAALGRASRHRRLRTRRRPGDARARFRRAARRPSRDGAELIDVREKDERDTGYIAGSRNIPYRLLALGEADLPRDKPIVTICESGPRAAIAASILSARGFDAHPVVNGGIDSWAASGKPTVEFRRCGG